MSTRFAQTYERSFVVIEFSVFEHEPSSSPVLWSEARAAQLVHPALLLSVFELEARHKKGRVRRLFATN